ncbi:uncharacterized protein LOC119377008 [Rhipicephalus sanguineus]|uniref:uncharacterized protein LOC119377008 n=1 Tax=Rhipicephalus sanguineus TaxID=34632 RepID=UPI0020C30973|nr:uncharacterized protein LOC119377008 [Rhipicephalus sanguineus]
MSWSKSLAVIPETLTEEKVEAYSASKRLAKHNDERSHKFAVESYVQTASIETSSYTDSDSTLIRVRALCYRSQKKTAPAYKVSATFFHDGSIQDCTCECAVRENGACHHILGLLKVVLLLKENGYNEAPPELSCTELPQQWRRPRGEKITACGVDELDWRAPRPGGLERPTPSRLYEARKRPRLAHEVQLAALKYGEALETHAPSPFARHLRNMKAVPATSTFGETCVGSLLWCQKTVLPHHFTTYISPDIQLGVTAHPHHPTPPEPDLFTSTTVFASSSVSLPNKERAIFEPAQSKSTEWKKARKYRLTASNFGTVVAREKWTPKGLQNLTSDKDLSRVRAVQYGISNERQAVRRYEAALRTALHDVQTFHCGLVVSPTSPWLGASPDRIVWDPQENSHGIIEVKCPYSMKDMDEPTTQGSCLYKDTDNVFRLDRRHQYYYQLLGQMAICGLSWADFVVYSPQFLVVERIKYDDAAWQQCKVKLNKFYFSTLLPYFASRDHPLQPSNS